MNPTILAAGILPSTSFTIGGASQQIAYVIGVNPVTVPQSGSLVLSILLQIKSPSGLTIYENAGYVAGNFGSPDSLTGAYDLPFLTGTTTPETGVYLINIKARYVDSTSSPVTTLATVSYSSASVCVGCLPSPNLNFDLNCTNVLFTTTDVTNYCLTGYSFISVTRSLTLSPPSGSNQPSPTTADKSLLIDDGAAGNGDLWNGLYSATLIATATYQMGSTTIVQSLTLTSTYTVSCVNSLCTITCLLNAIAEEYVDQLNTNPALAVSTLQKMSAGSTELLLARENIRCGIDYQENIDNFYTVTGLKKGCKTCSAIEPVGPVSSGCGCGGSGGGSSPGQRGSDILFGSGAPSGGLGLDGDMYINTANGDVYSKVSGSWGLELNIKGTTGSTGATGAQGIPGLNGSAEFWNPLINYNNTGAGASDVWDETIPAATFTTVGDRIIMTGDIIYNGNLGPYVWILFKINGTARAVFAQTSSSVAEMKVTVNLVYSSANTMGLNVATQQLDSSGTVIHEDAINLSDFSYTTANAGAVEIDFSALSGSANAVQLVSLTSLLIKMP